MEETKTERKKAAGMRPAAARVKAFIRKHWAPITLLIVVLIVFHEWFFSFSNLTWGDWWFFSSKGMFRIPYMWDAGTLFGLPLAPSFYPILALGGLLANMGFGFPVIERVLYMWPAVIVGSLGSYYLCRRITKSELAGFAGSFVFIFNTPTLGISGFPIMLNAFAFAPLIILFFMKTLDEKRYYLAVVTALLSCIVGFYDLRVFAIIAFVMVLYAIYHTLLVEKPTIKLALRNAFLTLVPFVAVFLTNLYWLLGFSKAGGFSTSPAFTREIWGNEFLGIGHAATLHLPFWNGSKPVVFVTHEIQWYFYLVPILALLGLILGRKNRNVVFFGIISLIGIMLVKQSGGPFPGLYLWLFHHIPGFKMFREASKFYLLISLGYAVLIAAFVKWLAARPSKRKWDKTASYVIVALILILFLFNTVPIVTGSFGALFAPRRFPEDNRKFNEFISEQNSYFRTLWVPEVSRWAVKADRNPAVSLHEILMIPYSGMPFKNTSWKGIIEHEMYGQNTSEYYLMTTLFKNPIFPELLANDSIKYVVLPVRYDDTEDDFFKGYGVDRDRLVQALDKVECLKRINIGTNELAVFENKSFRPYVDSEVAVYRVDTLSELGNKCVFAEDVLGERFSFVVREEAYGGNLTDLHNLFEPSERQRVGTSGDAVRQEYGTSRGKRENTVFRNDDRRMIVYETTGGNLVVSASYGNNLFLNGAPLNFPAGSPMKQVASAPLEPGKDYYLLLGGSLVPMVPGPPRVAGVLAPGKELSILSCAKASLVPNGSFEQGLWQKDVQDFNNYDKRPVLAMRITQGEEGKGSKAVELEAARHIAATVQNGIPVNPGSSYLISIDYESPTGDKGEYQLDFSPGGTQIKVALPVNDKRWHTYQTIVKIPEGTSSANLALLCSPREGGEKAVVRYDDVELVEVNPIAFYRMEGGGFERANAPVSSSENTFDFREPGYVFSSLVPNGSFEQGLWQKDVQDFNNYDKRPVLAMRITQGEEGKGSKAVELEAARHIAATVQNGIPVNPGSSYLISIDYESPTGDKGEYQLDFSPGGTEVKRSLPVSDRKWHTYQTIVKIPEGTSSANLALLCSPREEGEKAVVRYDDVELVEIPDFINWYYLVSAPVGSLDAPGKIEFKDINPTKKTVHVSSASTSFFLSMSESYHPGWKMTVSSNGKSFTIPDRLHYKLDDVSNAWYVDLTELAEKGLASKNADGTYDIDMVVDFPAQQYCYAGFVISLLTLLALLIYLVVDWRRRRAKAD